MRIVRREPIPVFPCVVAVCMTALLLGMFYMAHVEGMKKLEVEALKAKSWTQQAPEDALWDRSIYDKAVAEEVARQKAMKEDE